eukprot:TRINITY_DN5381_c0_g1_i9.p1 TRINITY_DN5381_c0_g1~~TRINITY_DN5381_c0_g1_i9.p1  ORF type:complete len:336 (-),score=50.73 TRINITY_DN5381_c0_g1_i9:523-1530(-)
MQYVRLGSSGLKVSRICLGMMSYGDPKWRPYILGLEDSRPFFKRALELGINFFDTADFYSIGESERLLGTLIKEFNVKREDIIIATKVYYGLDNKPNSTGLSRKHIFDAIDDSLKRLNTTYVDLYQIHRWDKNTPIEETMEALHDVVKSGKARYIGASSMYAWQFAKAQHIAEKRGWTKFISMQNHYNLIYREEEREMIPLCIDQGVGLIPWSPLARGVLAGNVKRGENNEEEKVTIRAKTDDFSKSMYPVDVDWPVIDRCVELAKKKGVKPAQIAIAWILAKKGVVAPIVGATKLYQLEEAVEALKIELTPVDITFLEALYKPHKVLGNLTPTD